MKTKKQFTKQLMSIFLCFVMLLTYVPATVLAADGDPCAETDCTGTYKGGICTYNSTHYEKPTETTDVYDLDGDEVKDTVYEIANEGQLRWFAAQVNGGSVSLNAVLKADIALTTDWIPIGNGSQQFQGNFDGQNYTVDFALYSSALQNYSGLFGYSTGSIKNVKVYNFAGNYTNYQCVAAVVGYNKGTISNCVNSGVMKDTLFRTGSSGGGIAGYNDGGTIENCTSYIPIYGNSSSGGIAGKNNLGTIKNCINYGKITAYTQYHGGIVGENYKGTVENCVNYGEFAYGGTPSFVGGIAGSNRGNMINCSNSAYVCGAENTGGVAGYNDVEIAYCKNTGQVKAISSADNQGGIVGYNAGTISACFNSGEIIGASGDGYVGGIAGCNYDTIKNCANIGYINSSFAGAIAGNNSGSINSCYNYGELKANVNAYAVAYWNNGSFSNVYYKNGELFYDGTKDATATKMTEEQFARGEVAYLLNNKATDGTQVWYQNIDNGKTVDAYPVLDNTSGAIYRKCNGISYAYSNSNEGSVHSFTGECDSICDICEYTREVSVAHIEGTPANCSYGAICQICGSEYGEKSGNHDVNEETAMCSICNHQFALKYLPSGQTTPLYTDNANTALDACVGRSNEGVNGGTVTLFADVTYSGNFKEQMQGCTSTIVLNGHTLTLSGRGIQLWSTKLTIDGSGGGTLNCTSGSPIEWNSTTVKIIGNPSYKQNGNEVALKFVGLSSSTPTIDLTEYTGSGFTFTQSYSASITVNLSDKYMLVNANTGEAITSADVVKGVTAKVVYKHIHDWKYTVSGTTITATCTADGCTNTDGGYVTISAPSDLTYTGSKIEAVVDNKITTGAIVEVTYTGNTTEGYPVNAGDYTASIALGNEIVDVQYTIEKATPTADDFIFIAPTDLICDGSDKAATVTVKDGIIGMGEIQVMYFRYYLSMWYDNQRAPHYPGKYKVGIWLKEGDNYNGVSSTDRIWLGNEFDIVYLETTDEATISGTTGENGWYTSNVTLTPPEGYQISKTKYSDGFGNTLTVSDEQNGTFTYYLRNTDGEIAEKTVELKIDKTAPVAEYKIGTDGWKQFINTITFGLFCKDYKTVEINYNDNLSGVSVKQYYIASADVTDLSSINWSDYTNTLNLNATGKYFIYMRVTDTAGHEVILNTEGIVIYEDSVQVTESVSTTYQAGTNKDVTVELNGNTVKTVENGTTVLIADTDYTVSADGKITLKSAYLDTLNAGTYTFTVSYNPLGMEYVEATRNDAPATTAFNVVIEKADGKVTNINISDKTYNGTAVTAPTYDKLGDGTATIEYKVSGSDDSTYTTTAPKNAGDYVVRVNVAEGTNHKAASATAEFTINRPEITNVSVQQNGKLTYNGQAQTPNVSTNAEAVDNQLITFTYSTEQNGNYGDLPTFTTAGTYTVYFKATAPNHNDAIGSFTVTVNKAIVTEPTIASKPYTGSTQTADITDTKLYTVVENDGGTGVKLNGYYDVVLELKDSANYKWSTTDNAQVTLQFAITRAENEWAVNPSISDWTYGETANEPVGEAKFGEVSVEYSGTTNDRATYSSTNAPTEAGDYTATFIVQETEDYRGLNKSVDFTIAKADQAAPTGLTKTDTTYFGKADGKISGLTSAMEFRKEGDSAYTAGFNGTLEYLAAGTYYVRYQGYANHNPSPDAVVTVNAGRKLQIVVPQNQVGYTVTVNKTEMEYEGSYTLKVEIHEGYTATENFKIIISNWECGQEAGVEETYMNAIADQIIEVQGVADITPPAAEIKIENNKWSNFWNDLTFGLFFKETQDVTITASDIGSGVKSIQYYLSNGELELDEVRAITDWVDYNGTFKIDPNNRYVVYAKVTDNAGNTLYINTDGIVLDNIAPTLEGIENGKTYYGDLTVIKSDEQFYDIKAVTLDGEEMGFAEGTYGLIPADNAEHIVVVEDHAGNKTTYTVTVYKNYTVTYKADGETVSTETVGHGKDATLPAVPAKEGFVGKWDAEGKNITNDTTISVVYTEIPAVKPDEVKPEDKSDLEDAKAKLEEMLEDDSYTDDDKKDIQDAIDDIDDALEVIGNVEAVEELIGKLPENITKNDEEAIKAADDAYNALSDYEKSLVDEDIKKSLDDAKAALAELNKPADTTSPNTGDNSNLWLWIALLFVSGGAVIALTVVDKKRRMVSKR